MFDTFPAFRRGVVIAAGIDNGTSTPQTTCLLAEAVSAVHQVPSSLEQERLRVWDEVYSLMGSNPAKYTPSIRFLLEQIRRGKPPRSINPIVDLFNATSLRWTTPCGGDDLVALNGADICLGIARGDETFAPLFKPATIERPDPGEIIYYAVQSRRVMCRRWTWRNADFSKLTPATKAVAVNVDMMVPPFAASDLERALAELATSVQDFCGGDVRSYVIEPEKPSFSFELLPL